MRMLRLMSQLSCELPRTAEAKEEVVVKLEDVDWCG